MPSSHVALSGFTLVQPVPASLLTTSGQVTSLILYALRLVAVGAHGRVVGTVGAHESHLTQSIALTQTCTFASLQH